MHAKFEKHCPRDFPNIFQKKKKIVLGFTGGSEVKNLPACRRPGCSPWVRKIPWRREWVPTPLFLPGEFHGQRSLEGYSLQDPKELDIIERLTLSLLSGKKR